MADNLVVSTKNGKVRGIKQKSNFSGASYYAFYGVPYGQPPVDNLRFKDPVKVNSWKSTRDATIPRDGCIQYSMRYFNILGSEDCLYVNVYTPELPSSGTPLKAVIVLIHPGGYTWGSPDPSNHGSPNFVIHNDIVYVTVCFRLHILGFLNLDLPECSGNQALKDIIMALEWVQTNIHSFNGDAKNVTLFGSSSGAELVHFLMLSPLDKGLFHKAVLSGGYAFNPVVFRQSNTGSEQNIRYVESLGFEGGTKKQLLRLLKIIPALRFFDQMRFFMKGAYMNAAIAFPGGLFTTSIDKGKNAVLPDTPRNLLPSTKRIPLLVGICEHEGIVAFTNNFREMTEKHLKTAVRQNCWGWANDLKETEIDFVNKQIESFYMKDYTKNNVPLSVKEQILSDASYSDLYDTLIDFVSADRSIPVFVYQFQYDGEVAYIKSKIQQKIEDQIPKGTFHADDFGYWGYSKEPTTTQTKNLINTYTKLITNFAKTGDPSNEDIPITWRPSTPDNPCHLQITDTLKMVEGKLNGDRFEFWQNLKKQLNRNRITNCLDK